MSDDFYLYYVLARLGWITALVLLAIAVLPLALWRRERRVNRALLGKIAELRTDRQDIDADELDALNQASLDDLRKAAAR